MSKTTRLPERTPIRMPRALARLLTAAMLVVAAAPICYTQEPLGVFSINDASVSEGNAGTKTLTFTVASGRGSSISSERRVSFVTEDGSAAGSTTYTARGSITVNDVVPATPYPATLVLSGLRGPLRHLKVSLNSVTHTSPADLDIVLVGPGGQKVMLMSDAGGGNPITDTFLTFDDGAPAMTTGQLMTGTYRPTDLQPGDTLPPSAPAGPYGTTLEVFNGTDPNGTWSLYVVDDAGVDVGTSRGFSLMVTTDDNDFVPTRGELVFAPGVGSQTVDIQIIGDAVGRVYRGFFRHFVRPSRNASIDRAVGLGVIINDDFAVPATGTATAISPQGATLNGTVEPAGALTTAYFECGLTTSYGGTTAAFTLGSGTAPIAIGNGTIAGLACNTLYHFNIRASNVAGTTTGSDRTFTTFPCERNRTSGDVDGDQKTDLAVLWHRPRPAIGILQSSTNCTEASHRTTVGCEHGRSRAGGLRRRRQIDLAVYRPSTGYWYVLLSSTNYTSYLAQPWGISGDIPVPGDYDGDGKTDLGLYRPSTGYWYILLSSTNYTTSIAKQWGISTDVAVAGDYDGDGGIDASRYIGRQPATGTSCCRARTTPRYLAHAVGSAISGDIPVTGDYDGDGNTDLGVYRPSTGYWYILLSSTNYTTSIATTVGL